MGCACKNTNNISVIDEENSKNSVKNGGKNHKNTVNRWITFIFLVILSPLFIFPLIYLFYKVIIKTETLNISEFFKNLMKIIKYKIKMEQDGDLDLNEYEIHDLNDNE